MSPVQKVWWLNARNRGLQAGPTSGERPFSGFEEMFLGFEVWRNCRGKICPITMESLGGFVGKLQNLTSSTKCWNQRVCSRFSGRVQVLDYFP